MRCAGVVQGQNEWQRGMCVSCRECTASGCVSKVSALCFHCAPLLLPKQCAPWRAQRSAVAEPPHAAATKQGNRAQSPYQDEEARQQERASVCLHTRLRYSCLSTGISIPTQYRLRLTLDSAHRRLLQILLLSATVHLVVLLAMGGFAPTSPPWPSVERAGKLIVTRIAAPPALVASGFDTPGPPSDRSAILKQASPALATPGSRAVPLARSKSHPSAIQRSARPDVGKESPAEVPLASPVVPPAHQEISADGLRQYKLALAIQARAFKRYPALARERGWEGTVEILVVTGPALSAPAATISRRSNHAPLDEQALSMVENALRITDLPASLYGKEVRLLLPVQFSLDGDR